MALVLYRKYRPKTFQEVIGQDHVVKTLQNALKFGRVSHAYLFTGPRGTGKTTVARLLGKSVNCAELSGEAGEPLTTRASAKAEGIGGLPVEACNVCIHCKAFLSGTHPDLIEMDAASNRGIDEIRQLKEGIRMAPVLGRFKTYIVDEAHMLTKEAFNALLKTLEEPPSHALFILATTEAAKVPVTIASRCQRFDFKTVPLELISERLQKIVTAEGKEVREEAIELIAQAAEGSFRDAESMLEQVLAFVEGPVREEDAMAVLGVPDLLVVQGIAEALAGRDTAAAIAGVNNAIDKGIDAVNLGTALSSYLRDVLLVAIDPKLSALVSRRVGAAHRASIEAHAQKFSAQALAFMIPKFVDALELIKRSPVPQLPLELAILEVTQQPDPLA